MKFDLKTPCKNCPFRNDDTRITFSCAERAEEIEEIAYRQGFVCHLSAETVEHHDGEETYEFGENSQHCAGALIMYAKSGQNSIPMEELDDEEGSLDALLERLDMNAPVFEDEESFIEANS